MKCTGMLILSMMVALSAGLVIAQDAAETVALSDMNVTNITNLTNATNVTNMTNVTNVTTVATINVTEVPVVVAAGSGCNRAPCGRDHCLQRSPRRGSSSSPTSLPAPLRSWGRRSPEAFLM